MARYRRSYIPGGTFFFTVVTYNRKPILVTEFSRQYLKDAWNTITQKYPFDLVACCLMPNHLHCIWTMPENDFDYSIRWRGIKGLFSRQYQRHINPKIQSTESYKKKREAAIWQRRFWEHTIFSQDDFNCPVDYIHCNPVKHGFVRNPIDWPWSTFHRYTKMGIYEKDWGVCEPLHLKEMETTGE
ncbi:MAG TPA: transposase [bacterium]